MRNKPYLLLTVLIPIVALLACASHEPEASDSAYPASDPGPADQPVAIESLDGSEWVLVAWGQDDPVAAEPEVTISFATGQIAGTSGCNRYTAGVTAGEAPGAVTVGPVAGTKRMCAPEAMDVEQRFSGLLGSVTSLGLRGDRLVLAATVDGAPAALLFERRD